MPCLLLLCISIELLDTSNLPNISTTQVLKNDFSCLTRTSRALQKHQLLQQQPCLQTGNTRVEFVALGPHQDQTALTAH
jgi:hypothetical protein